MSISSKRYLWALLCGMLLVGCGFSRALWALDQSPAVPTLPVNEALSANKTLPVNETLSRALESHQLLALGDIHGSKVIVNQLVDFLRDERHWQQVDDLVVEFGNARYQSLADRYVLRSEPVPLQQLRPIWRDTLYFMAWQYAVYEDLVVQLHQWNRARDHKVRLVLAEPAFDWQALTTAGWQQQVDAREAGYVRIIEREVLAKNRRGILLFGGFHTIKAPVNMSGRGDEPFHSVVAILERQSPGRVFTQLARMTGDGVEGVAGVSPPYLLTLQNSILGARAFSDLTARVAPRPQPRLQDVADVFLYTASTDRNAPVAEAAREDKDWHREMRRRAEIVPGRPKQQIHRWLDQHGY